MIHSLRMHFEAVATRSLADVALAVRQSSRSSEGSRCTVEAGFADSRDHRRAAAGKWADWVEEGQEEAPSNQFL